jgi:hypothetical protein
MTIPAGAACAKCGSTKRLTRHHIVPRSAGGPNDRRNLQILCRACHDEIDGCVPRRARREKKSAGTRAPSLPAPPPQPECSHPWARTLDGKRFTCVSCGLKYTFKHWHSDLIVTLVAS